MNIINVARRVLGMLAIVTLAACSDAAKPTTLDMSAPPIKTIAGTEVTIQDYRSMDAAQRAAFEAEFANDAAAKAAWERMRYQAGGTVTAGDGKTKIEATRIAALDHTVATLSTDTGAFGADMTDVVMMGAKPDGSVATSGGQAVVTQSHQLAQEKMARVVVDRGLQIVGGMTQGLVTQTVANLTKCAGGGCSGGANTTWNIGGGVGIGGEGGEALSVADTNVGVTAGTHQQTAALSGGSPSSKCSKCKGTW